MGFVRDDGPGNTGDEDGLSEWRGHVDEVESAQRGERTQRTQRSQRVERGIRAGGKGDDRDDRDVKGCRGGGITQQGGYRDPQSIDALRYDAQYAVRGVLDGYCKGLSYSPNPDANPYIKVYSNLIRATEVCLIGGDVFTVDTNTTPKLECASFIILF